MMAKLGGRTRMLVWGVALALLTRGRRPMRRYHRLDRLSGPWLSLKRQPRSSPARLPQPTLLCWCYGTCLSRWSPTRAHLSS